MRTNKILGFVLSAAALIFATTACEDKKEDLGAPSIDLEKSEISFEKDGGTQTIQVTATRDWKATTEQDWISIDPREGKASSQPVTVEIKVIENTGVDREGAVRFDIGFDAKTLTLKQAGTGSAADLIVYKNDFDKEKATNTYGTGTSWPYLDQFDGWKNATGTGVGSETYAFNAISARANSTSNGNYSDYSGSGVNNLFFGSNAYFSVTGVKLGSDVNYSLTFGSEKFLQDGDKLFKHNEFHVYVSNDGKKWVELEYSFPNGDKEGRWDLATSNFTVPSGTTTLGVYVKADVASAYRLDDLCLSVASAAGTVIDFSKGVELGTGGGSDTPGSDYDKAESKTVKDFIAAASTSTYYKLKGKVSGFNAQYCSFDLTDETGTIYVYSVDSESKSAYSSKIKNGGTVELAGLYKQYNGKDEVVSAHILSFTEGSGESAKEMTIAQALAAPAGTAAIVSGTVAATYKRGFIITDGNEYILVYDGSKCAAKEKDNVKVSGTTASYGGLIQLGSPEVTVVSSGNALTLPSPKVLDGAAFNSYSSSKIEYVTYEGTLSVSGNYFNVNVPGATSLIGSLTYVNDSFNAASFDKTEVKVTGFYVGTSGSTTKYLNTMVTELVPGASSYLQVGSTSLSAAAEATSATFDVKANVAWTVTSDNSAYTVEPASGDKNATVTVKFPANTTDADKVVKLTVSTTADVATKSYTVTLTHQGKSSASEVKLVIEGNGDWTAASDETYGAGYEFTKDGIKYAYYQYKSTSSPVAPSADHIRIYKSSVFVIVPPAGKKIEKVVLDCVSGKCVNMTVLPDNSIAVSDVKTNTVTWTGSVDKYVAQADVAQIRAKSITVVLK